MAAYAPVARQVPAGVVEVGQELRPVAAERSERLGEPLLALRAQRDGDHTAVVRARRAHDEARRLRPVDELGRGALGELEVVGNPADGARRAAVGRPLHRQEQQVPLRGEAEAPHRGVAVGEKPSQAPAELGRVLHLGERERSV